MSQESAGIAWGREIDGLRLGISLQERYLLDEPMVLEIFVTNAGSEERKIVEGSVLREYQIEVFDESRRLAPMTPAGALALQAAMSGEVRRRMVIALEPGATHKVDERVRLDEWFELKTPGTFTAVVHRRDWQDEQGLLESAPLTFTVDDRAL